MSKLLVLLCILYVSLALKLFDREEAPPGWRMVRRAPQHEIVKLRIALRQYNLHMLEVRLPLPPNAQIPQVLKY